MLGVYKDRSAHCALVFSFGLKWLSYIAHTSNGPRIFKARIEEFNKEFRVLPDYTSKRAALAYLDAALRAYEHDPEVNNQLLEIIMPKQLNEMSLVELALAYNELAKPLGKKPRKSFKSKSEGIKAIEALDSEAKKATPAQRETEAKKEEKAAKVKAAKPKAEKAEGARKPRGSGIGAFCTDLIAKGKTNDEVLAAVQKKFPDAKTTKGCIAFYRNKAKQ